MFSLKSAIPVARYDSRFMKCRCVISKNSFGKGTVWYVGSVVEDKVASILLRNVLKSAGIEPVAISDNELMELTEVAGASGKYVYALNFSNKTQTIRLNKAMTDVLTNGKFSTSVSVKPMDYRLLKIE